MKKIVIFFAIILFASIQVSAKVVSKAVEYKDGETILQGWLYFDDAIKIPKPGVIVVHEWWGLDDYAKSRGNELAKLGYVAFVADIFGKGVLFTDFQSAGANADKYKQDTTLLRSRIKAALSVFKKQKQVDVNNIAAMGYCFGGTTVLELARSGVDIKGVISFHGGLSTPNPDDAHNIKTKVLVCHGAVDPFVSAEELNTFISSMNKAGTDYQLISYSNAVHGFSNVHNGDDPSKGLAYNENADKRSWNAMQQFFDDIFK
ncbi:MAG: dienelactone hydrolase family protein [Cloacibacterium sp.]|uniref:dienelactone hydrolase family protein n=1 Tax=Cloacibacterium sp. TaxID=1913682 RepID=UPI003C78304B